MNDSMRRVLNMSAQFATGNSAMRVGQRNVDRLREELGAENIPPNSAFIIPDADDGEPVFGSTDDEGEIDELESSGTLPALVYDPQEFNSFGVRDEAPEGLIYPGYRYGYSGILLTPDDERLNLYIDEVQREA